MNQEVIFCVYKILLFENIFCKFCQQENNPATGSGISDISRDSSKKQGLRRKLLRVKAEKAEKVKRKLFRYIFTHKNIIFHGKFV